MSGGKIILIAFGSAVLGGLVVAIFFSGQIQKVTENFSLRFNQSTKSQSPMISGFNRPLEKDI